MTFVFVCLVEQTSADPTQRELLLFEISNIWFPLLQIQIGSVPVGAVNFGLYIDFLFCF